MERRWRKRRAVNWQAHIGYKGIVLNDCLVRDVSPDGMYVQIKNCNIPEGIQVRVSCLRRTKEATQRVENKGLVVHAGRDGVGLLLLSNVDASLLGTAATAAAAGIVVASAMAA